MLGRSGNGLAALMLGLLALPAAGSDLALIVAQRSYEGMAPLGSSLGAAGLADDLRAQGWSVFTVTDASPAEMRDQARKLRMAMQRTPESDRVIIAVSGLTATSGRDSWLLANDAERPDMLNVGAHGLSLGALAEIAGMEPGRAVLIVGREDTAAALGMGLTPGAAVTPPQGVIVVSGPINALRRWVGDALLRPENSIHQALGALPAGAEAAGYSSRAESFGAPDRGAAAAGPGQTGEMAYWNAVRDIGSLEALQAYLNRYPNGIFAAQAQAQVVALTRDPADLARQGEEALNLGREARRQIQRNLDLLGFDPRGIDGLFGRGSRAAISAWQRSSGYADTGFLAAGQVAELQRQADIRAAELEREAALRRQEEERADRQFWQQLGRDEASLRRYLGRYPDGLFAEDAQARLDVIIEGRRAEAEARERGAWDAAQAEGTIAAYRGFLTEFPDGVFAAEARERIAELEAEVANADQVERLRAQEAQILPNRAARQVVEQILAARGFKPGEVDGEFTRETRRALRRFQRERGLEATGFVTQRTMVVLMLSR